MEENWNSQNPLFNEISFQAPISLQREEGFLYNSRAVAGASPFPLFQQKTAMKIYFGLFQTIFVLFLVDFDADSITFDGSWWKSASMYVTSVRSCLCKDFFRLWFLFRHHRRLWFQELPREYHLDKTVMTMTIIDEEAMSGMNIGLSLDPILQLFWVKP